VSSPLARALVGKEEGDVVRLRLAASEVEYEIEKVEHL
jgi:transcription elongation factor GreA